MASTKLLGVQFGLTSGQVYAMKNLGEKPRAGIVSVHQPQVFAPMHLVQRMVRCSNHVMMDGAQVNRKSGMATYRIGKGRRRVGEEYQVLDLRIPIDGGNRSKCNEAKICADNRWISKHACTLELWYKGAEFKELIVDNVRWLLSYAAGEGLSLAQFGRCCTTWLFSVLHSAKCWYPTTAIESVITGTDLSSMSGTDRIEAAVTFLKGDTYHCGKREDRLYLDESQLNRAGITVWSQDYVAPSDGDLSWIHYLAWEGKVGLVRRLEQGTMDDAPVGSFSGSNVPTGI